MSKGTLQKTVYLIIRGTQSNYSRIVDGLSQPRIVSAKNGIPATKAGEIPIKLTIKLPQSLFQNPTYSAEIAVDEDAVSSPAISAEVINNIENVVAEATGLTLTIESEAAD